MGSSALSPDRVLDEFDDLAPPGTPLTTAEVADAFDFTDRTVFDKLAALADDGPLETKKVGARGRVWWRPVGGGTDGAVEFQRAREAIRSHPVFDSEMVGVIVWGSDLTIRDANDAFLEMAGFEYEAALGTSWRDLTPEEFYQVSERHVEQVDETGNGVPYEKQYYHRDGSRWWGRFESRKLNDGGYVEFVIDVTERRRREAELETRAKLRGFRADLADAIRPLADPVEIQNEAMGLLEERLGVEQARYGEVLSDGDAFRTLSDPTFADEAPRNGGCSLTNYGEFVVESLRAGDDVVFDDYRDVPEIDGEERALYGETGTVASVAVPLVKDGRLTAFFAVRESSPREWTETEVEMVRETAERTWAAVERARAEAELRRAEERQRLALDAGDLGIWELDLERGGAATSSPRHAAIFGYDEPVDDWHVERFFDHVHPDDRDRVDAEIKEGLVAGGWDLECRIVRRDGERRWISSRAEVDYENDDAVRVIGIVQDVTERKAAQEALLESEAALERLNAATEELIDAETATIADRLAPLARNVLGVEYAALWRYDDRSGHLEERTVDAADDLDVESVGISTDVSDAVWQTFVGAGVTVEPDLAGQRDGSSSSSASLPLRSCAFVPLGHHGVVWLGSTRADAFDERAVDLAETVGATVETAWDRAEGEQRLAERNAALERLDQLNGLIRGVQQRLLNADSREAIERAVVAQLAESELYEFAWIGTRDPTSETVEPRARSGVDSGYLETFEFSTDGAAPNEDPIAAATRTGDLQVVGDVATDPRAAAWREATLERGARSCVAIPIRYNGSGYGVLAVYAPTPQSDERDHAVLEELGETVAHAIDALETKRTLLTDSVTELTLRTRSDNDVLAALARKVNCEIEFDGLVPRSDGVARLFFTTRDADAEDVLDVAQCLPGIDEVTLLRDGENGAVFDATITGSTLASHVVDNGGFVRSLSVSDETTTLVVDQPAAATVREFVETVRSAYPSIELVSRRSRDRPIGTREDLRAALSERLTARQREVLETAYRSGYFESPRVQTGADLAETLDVTQSTFSHHLREGERRFCELVFDSQ